MHGLFQMKFYGEKIGLPTDGHEQYVSHRFFESCMQFCRSWDQASFDPNYASQPLTHFEPMVREIFSRPAFDPSIIGAPGKRARVG